MIFTDSSRSLMSFIIKIRKKLSLNSYETTKKPTQPTNQKQTNKQTKKPQDTQSNPEQNTAGRRVTIPDLIIDYRSMLIKIIWSQHKKLYVDQWNKFKDPCMTTCNISRVSTMTLTKTLKT